MRLLFIYWIKRTAAAVTLLAALTPAVLSCKKSTIGGGALREAGGSAASFTMAATLDTLGSIYVDGQGDGSEKEQWFYNGLQLQVASAPDGQIYNTALVERRYFALQSGDSDVTYNILVTTKGGFLCYTNGARVDGTGYAASCKAASDADLNGNLGSSISDRQRQALADSCQRLSGLRIDGSPLIPYYARYDRNRNGLACTCQNGKVRDLDFAAYANRSVYEFEDDCRRRSDGTDPPGQGVGGLDANEPSLAPLQRACTTDFNGALTADRRGCDCPGGKRLIFEGYVGRLDAFGEACL